jgi:hypothetical protein
MSERKDELEALEEGAKKAEEEAETLRIKKEKEAKEELERFDSVTKSIVNQLIIANHVV